MGDRFQHARHAFWVAAVLAAGFVVFLIALFALIPSDFGVLGYYRAGALDDIKALPIAYAGRAACMECHDGAYDAPDEGDDAPARKPAVAVALDPARDNKHFTLTCGGGHGPLQKHAEDQGEGGAAESRL